jgi:exosortase
MVYADFLDAWSLLPLIAGAVWILLGSEAMKWSLPPIAFLFLMIPMPYQAESLLSWKLQGVATELSTVFLRVLGQPAVSEGHVIWLGDQRLTVEEACSGMRIFIGVAALAFFWAAMVKRSWIDRFVILALVVPLAVFVNATRITFVGLLYQVFDDPASQGRIHDVSGYLMIPFAFLLLWGLKSYWEHLYRPVEQMTARDFIPGSA